MIQRNEWSLLGIGFLATLCGIGLARFAYTALMPEMVLAGWFTGEQVAYLGAANLLGYLVGALAAAPMAERFGPARVLQVCWIGTVLCFAACSVPQPVVLFFIWRCLSGLWGATLMVLGPSVAMGAAPVHRRAALGPLMFCGVGVGVLLSATLVPLLARLQVSAAWAAMAAVAALAGWLGMRCLRDIPVPAAPAPSHVPSSVPRSAGLSVGPTAPSPAVTARSLTIGAWTLAVLLLMAAYAGDAFGFVPHTIFWVDYLARELQLGSGYAASQWACFGLGALAGPLVASMCAVRLGWWATASGAYVLKTLAVFMPLWWTDAFGHALSGFIVGALSPGIAAITSGYLMQLVGAIRHKRMWGYATALFALMQAISGYLMAWIYARTGSYQSLFLYGGLALLCGTVLVLVSRSARKPHPLNE